MIEWLAEYQHLSLTKGKQHFKIQPTVKCQPWFHGMNLDGLEIKIITRLRTGHGLCGQKLKQVPTLPPS